METPYLRRYQAHAGNAQAASKGVLTAPSVTSKGGLKAPAQGPTSKGASSATTSDAYQYSHQHTHCH